MSMSNSERQKKYRDRLKEKELRNTPILQLDIVSFFERVNGFSATKQQEELLLSFIDPEVQNILCVCGRQTGKSIATATGIVFLSLTHKQDMLLCSAQSNWVYDHITTIFNNNQELKQYIAWSGVKGVIPLTGYETTIGSRVHLRGASEKALLGVPNIRVAVLDEGELMDDQTLVSATGTLSGKGIKLILLGTPTDRPSRFKTIAKDPKKYGFKMFTWSELNCPWHGEAELKLKQATYTPDEWNSQVLGRLTEDSEKRLWSSEEINACVKPQVFKE